MLEKLTMEFFSEHLNHSFQILPGSESKGGSLASIKAALVEVKPLGPSKLKSKNRQPFSLIFRGPVEPILPQKIYGIEHKGMERMELFLVPLGPDQEGMLYEAIFF